MNNGYEYKTKSGTIQRYIDIFKAYVPGKTVCIPRRSLSHDELTDEGIKLKITTLPHHGECHGFYAMFCNVVIIDEHYKIKSGVRKSLVANMYA